MRKIFTLFLFITLCSILPAAGQTKNWIDEADVSWYNEIETEFTISDAADLAGLAKLVNSGNTFEGKTIKLTQNITLNENVLTESGELNGDGSNFKQWTAIGTSSNRFKGIFDGQGHTISGIYINNSSDYQGLFGYLDEDGTIQNLSVTESYIKANDYVGGIVGQNKDGTVSSCSNSGTVTGTRSYASVGGIVGYNSSDSEVSNCSNSGTVTGGDNARVGGIVGENYADSEVSNCTNSGTVTGTGEYASVGGIVGGNYEDGAASNCTNSGEVTGGDGARVGGIVGRNKGTVSNCYYLDSSCDKGIGDDNNDQEGNVKSKTEKEYASGEVVRLLDPDGDTWGQKLDGNSYPVPLSCLSEEEREAYKVYTVTFSYGGKTETIYGNKNGVIEAPAEAIAPEGKIYVWNPELPYTIQGTETSPITITGTLQDKPEEPTDPEEPEEPETPVIPDMPKYYNIMVDECEGVTVETSSTVVREGQSMTFTIDIAEGYTSENMTVKVKRSLFGYTEVIEPNNEGIYEIKNIYTDIYITIDGVEEEEEEEEETPTGMEDVEGAKVYAKDGSIYVQTPQQEQVQIISISGAVLKNETQIGLQRYDLPRGIYIICIGEERFKVRN